ncbi:hypothetical protein CGH09_22275 [Vibrio parahaemolyticus]|uniref:hypothetical protein n=1 Tax=Vibrio parahaemolyticus TaxID=670 RepID=UPI00111EC955|nr:hypothetical protein [Vibrio parahaemolyticus]MCS0079860.1 hypothetical protein [Vibrio parahaemolyticus]TOP74550.1 hypothetical protein CGH09_22275 [Vibrio parahaemolyticus]HCH5095977.1 hypothetical protein [Vibrio parahaemolyticus]
MDLHEKLEKLRKKKMIISLLGLPFHFALVLGGMAYYADFIVHPILENQAVAASVLAAGVIGALIQTPVAIYLLIQIKKVNKAST